MKSRLLIITLAGLLSASLALDGAPKKKAKKKSEPAAPPASEMKQVVVWPSERLSLFLSSNLDAILAPLGSEGFNRPAAISELREVLGDDRANAPDAIKPAFEAAISICSALSAAVSERQKAVAHYQQPAPPVPVLTGVNGPQGHGTNPLETQTNLQSKREKRAHKEQMARDLAGLENQRRKQMQQSTQSDARVAWQNRSAELRRSIEKANAEERALERAAAEANPEFAKPRS